MWDFSSGAYTLVDSLKIGLSRFAGPTKVAAILSHGHQMMIGHPIRVFDEHGIFDSYRDELVSKLSEWPTKVPASDIILNERHCTIAVNSQAVTIVVARCHESVDSEVVRCWLAGAAAGGYWITNVAQSAKGLEYYVSEAISDVVRQCRAKHLGSFSEEVFKAAYFVDELTRVTRAVEEGNGATGTIAFVATDGPKRRQIEQEREFPVAETMDILAEFEKPIRLNDHKHVVKSLQLAQSECLWADHFGIRGVLRQPPNDSLVAKFNRGIADLSYAETRICRIVGGEARYVLKEPKDLLTPFLKCGEECLETIDLTIQSCRAQRHGATLVLSRDVPTFPMTAHKLKEPIKQPRSLIAAMSSVDGAILLDCDGNLYGYGYILDGDADPDSERLSRGARFNSALRFSRQIPAGFVLVISEDGPLTLFQNGELLYADPLSEVDPSRKPEKAITDGMDLTTWTVLPHTRTSVSGEMTVDSPQGKQFIQWDRMNT